MEVEKGKRKMNVIVEIPEKFEELFKKNKFQEQLKRIQTDLDYLERKTLSDKTERDLVDMLKLSFKNATISSEPSFEAPATIPKMNINEFHVYDTFKVETYYETNVDEIIDLGTYIGYVDDIAFALADENTCCLIFTPIGKQIKSTNIPNTKSVEIVLNCDKRFASDEDASDFFNKFFDGRDINVVQSSVYNHCLIKTNKETVEEKKKKALAKLTDEEKQLLGLS